MSKIDMFLKGLNRYELEQVLKKAKADLKSRRPFYLKQITKKCGQPDCRCQQGFEHGPYLYIYFSSGSGRQTQRSLGRVLVDEDFEVMKQEPCPRWYDYRISDKRLKSTPQADFARKGWAEYELSERDFENHYGVKLAGDLFDRPRTFYINRIKFDKDYDGWFDDATIAESRWARFGVGTLKGVKLLDGLVSQGYYHAD